MKFTEQEIERQRYANEIHELQREKDILESRLAAAEAELKILREAAKDLASDIYALPPEERENEHIYRKAKHLFELCDENGKTNFVGWFEDRVECEKKVESTTKMLAVAAAALRMLWHAKYEWAIDESYESLSGEKVKDTFCSDFGLTREQFDALGIGEDIQ